MNLSSPISSVIPSVHGHVLQVLSRADAPLSGRRTAELTCGRASRRQVDAVLHQLTTEGVVLRQHHPPAYLYRLNRDHVAAAGILALTDMRAALIDRIRAAADDWTLTSAAVWLFGSAARGDGSSASDVDVLVLRRDDVDQDNGHWLEQIDQLALQVLAWTGNRCEVLEYSESEFAAVIASGERIVGELTHDAIRITGDTVARRMKVKRAVLT